MTISSNGRGEIQCVGKNQPFDGPTSMTFEPYQLPATCGVQIDGKRGVFQVYGSGSTECNLTSGEVSCVPMVVVAQ